MDGERLHHLDNLRALALLAGVVFHAALAYSPLAQPFWPGADRAGSVLVDVALWWLHLFRMPLFFVVAGFFTALQVQRRGLAGMFRARLVRVGLPFVLLVPLLGWWMEAVTLHAATHVAHPSPLLRVIRDLMRDGGLPPMPPTTGHLWFLYYLMLFVVLAWVARALGLGAFRERLAGLRPAWLLVAWPVMVMPALASVPAPHPAPESLLPQFWAIAYYGAFFGFGYLLHGSPELATRHHRIAGPLVCGAVVAYAAYFVVMRQPTMEAMSAMPWLLALLAAMASVWTTLACLILARAFLQRPVRALGPVADASYWTYVVHLPVLLSIQYLVMDVELPWPAKLAVVVLSTLAICQASYGALVRRTVLASVFTRRAIAHRPIPGSRAPRPAPR